MFLDYIPLFITILLLFWVILSFYVGSSMVSNPLKEEVISADIVVYISGSTITSLLAVSIIFSFYKNNLNM